MYDKIHYNKKKKKLTFLSVSSSQETHPKIIDIRSGSKKVGDSVVCYGWIAFCQTGNKDLSLMIPIGGTQILAQEESAVAKIFTFGKLQWYSAEKKCASCYEVCSI